MERDKRMEDIKFSVITACYNSGKTIDATFDSILNQTYPNIEYIVIDGGSKDNTVEVIKSYEQKFKDAGINFKWISEDDDGIYDAWNKGLKMAEGDWIGFIGSDDFYYPDTFMKYYRYVKDHPELDFVSARTRMVVDGKVVRRMGEEWNWKIFKREMKVGHAGAIHNQKYFERYGLFDTSYKITGDYDLLLRARDELKFGFLKFYAAEMGGEGVSSTMIWGTLKEARRAKIEAGGRNPILAYLEFYYLYFKISLKNLILKFFPNAFN